MREMLLIAGPNGAGKTTAASWLLSSFKITHFLNADEVARGLAPFAPESVALEAGRIHLKRIDDMLLKGESFAIETTLSGKTHIKLIERAKKKGYSISIVYLFIDKPKFSVERVAYRVKEGGHNIPVATIERRFYKGIQNLLAVYKDLADLTHIIRNTDFGIEVIAGYSSRLKEGWSIYNPEKFQLLQELGNKKDA